MAKSKKRARKTGRKVKKKAARSGRRGRTTTCRGRPVKDKTITEKVESVERARKRLKNAEADLEYYKALYDHREACAAARRAKEEG